MIQIFLLFLIFWNRTSIFTTFVTIFSILVYKVLELVEKMIVGELDLPILNDDNRMLKPVDYELVIFLALELIIYFFHRHAIDFGK